MHPLIHASTIFAPFVALSGLASFAFGTSMKPLVEARPAFVLVPLLALVMAVMSQRRPALITVAHFASLLAFGLGIYGGAAVSGADPEFSLTDSPSLLIGTLAAAWSAAVSGAVPPIKS